MTRNKDLKRLVRARMEKTGEAYTAARAQLTKKSGPVTATEPDYAALAGMSDAAIEQKTGSRWKSWVTLLDQLGAHEMAHRDIAALVSRKFGIDAWWSQSVTVGYERIKGLRARGQRRDGTYEAGKSRTFPIPVERLFDAWRDPELRRRWMDVPDVKIRTATPHRTMRLAWPDGSIVAVGFTAKGKGKSSVALAHAKLPDRDAVERMKRYWSDRLDALGGCLEVGDDR